MQTFPGWEHSEGNPHLSPEGHSWDETEEPLHIKAKGMPAISPPRQGGALGHVEGVRQLAAPNLQEELPKHKTQEEAPLWAPRRKQSPKTR